MQLNYHFVILALSATALSIAVPDAEDLNDCSKLGGVMKFNANELPAGVKASDVRKCVDHPLGRERYLSEASLAPFEKNFKLEPNPLDAREVDATNKCYNAAPYGCSKGYCWKSCGNSGQWCWTAYNSGKGKWIKCSRFQDCGNPVDACGIGGVYGGCSC